MTPATLVQISLETLERIKADLAELSAGSDRCGVWGEECPMQDVGKSYHAIRTTVEAIDAAIREAEQAEKGERPETAPECLKSVVCPQCREPFDLTWNDWGPTPATLLIRGCPSGGIYDVSIGCPKCDYREPL